MCVIIKCGGWSIGIALFGTVFSHLVFAVSKSFMSLTCSVTLSINFRATSPSSTNVKLNSCRCTNFKRRTGRIGLSLIFTSELSTHGSYLSRCEFETPKKSLKMSTKKPYKRKHKHNTKWSTLISVFFKN